MAQYVKTNWKNLPNTETPISAANLNKIEDCLVDLTNTDLVNVDPMGGVSGSGILVKFGNACQLAMTIVNPVSIGGSTQILQFPDGFKPYVDFSAPVISLATYEIVGIVQHIAANNVMTLYTNSMDAIDMRIACTYVTDGT